MRDGNAWAKYILEAITLYGSETEVTFQSHNWPHWGNDVVIRYMEDTAAVYKFIHDQTLMYINLGYTSDEISSMIRLPEYFEKVWYTRQYYGTVAHNSKAVYQKYMGWYDANPVHLNPLDPSERARKFVEYLGDTDRVLEMDTVDFSALVRRCAGKFRNRGSNIELSIYENISLCANGLMLESLMTNLLENAVKYSVNTDSPVKVTALKDVDGLTVTVSDKGQGIAAKEIPYVFEPFYRSDTARTRNTGYGLGLSLCKRIVELHGGTIKLRSEEGAGTEVVFTLPPMLINI